MQRLPHPLNSYSCYSSPSWQSKSNLTEGSKPFLASDNSTDLEWLHGCFMALSWGLFPSSHCALPCSSLVWGHVTCTLQYLPCPGCSNAGNPCYCIGVREEMYFTQKSVTHKTRFYSKKPTTTQTHTFISYLWNLCWSDLFRCTAPGISLSFSLLYPDHVCMQWIGDAF